MSVSPTVTDKPMLLLAAVPTIGKLEAHTIVAHHPYVEEVQHELQIIIIVLTLLPPSAVELLMAHVPMHLLLI